MAGNNLTNENQVAAAAAPQAAPNIPRRAARKPYTGIWVRNTRMVKNIHGNWVRQGRIVKKYYKC